MRRQLLWTLTVVALVAGCATPSAQVKAAGAGEDGSALAVPPDIAGTWHGSYWQLGSAYYDDDADCTLQVKEDSTFTATCTRSVVGANNIAKSSSWSGRVTSKGNHTVLKDEGGPWPWIVLSRHGKDTLSATTLDPLVGATIEMKFERTPHTTAGE